MTDVFGARIASVEELRTVYREPAPLVKAKKFPQLDARFGEFVALSSFCLLSTVSADGELDVSPRGGPAGFVRVLDDRHLLIPDLGGNNLLDSITNIVERPSIGMLVVVTGQDETVRINGRACITTDPDLLASWDGELRRPKAAIGVEVVEVYHHCAKSFRRGGVWDPTTWPGAERVPEFCETYAEMIEGVEARQIRDSLEEGYVAELTAERIAD